MPFTDLLRSTVFLTAGGATVLAVVAVLGIQRDENTTILFVAAIWWIAAAWIGINIGGAERAAESVRGPLAAARSVKGPARGSPFLRRDGSASPASGRSLRLSSFPVGSACCFPRWR